MQQMCAKPQLQHMQCVRGRTHACTHLVFVVRVHAVAVQVLLCLLCRGLVRVLHKRLRVPCSMPDMSTAATGFPQRLHTTTHCTVLYSLHCMCIGGLALVAQGREVCVHTPASCRSFQILSFSVRDHTSGTPCEAHPAWACTVCCRCAPAARCSGVPALQLLPRSGAPAAAAAWLPAHQLHHAAAALLLRSAGTGW